MSNRPSLGLSLSTAVGMPLRTIWRVAIHRRREREVRPVDLGAGGLVRARTWLPMSERQGKKVVMTVADAPGTVAATMRGGLAILAGRVIGQGAPACVMERSTSCTGW